NGLAEGVLLCSQSLELAQGCAVGHIGGSGLVNQFFTGTAGTLAGLDGVWVITKQI
ncbi:MAG: hypothetical protein RJA35_1090, partial [Actinomycetota bacterium]